jgi:hypothetical protein
MITGWKKEWYDNSFADCRNAAASVPLTARARNFESHACPAYAPIKSNNTQEIQALLMLQYGADWGYLEMLPA